MTTSIKTVCVYCGSKHGTDPQYAQAAGHLGRFLVQQGCDLVFGGGSIGLMGTVADAVMGEGGRVTGVITRQLSIKEVRHDQLTELITVETMHERKAIMADRADAFIALPGGLGTLEELAEILTWGQLGIHQKPVGCLNVKQFFDPLVNLVTHMESEGFVKPEHRDLLLVNDTADALWKSMTEWQAPTVPKWLNREDR